MKKESQITQQVIAELTATDEKKLLKSIEKIKSKGNDQIIPPLLDLFVTTNYDSVKSAIKNLLNELKTSTGLVYLIEGLKLDNQELQEVILGALWSSGMNPKEYLPEIVHAACNGNYMIAVEAITIIENLEGPFDEEKVTEAKLTLNEYFSQPEDDKKELIKAILILINEIDESLEA